MGHPRFHARQLFQWLHKRGVTDFSGMTDLGRDLRASLASAFRVATPEVVRRETSSDGTAKFLLRLEDGQLIESVFIPDTPANTFCLSTQVGCAMKCGFCLTGKMGIIRNLTAGEIAGQVRVLVKELDMLRARFNIVLMGMGEPLHNYDAVLKALRILADEHGLAVNPRRVTLSTVGVLPALERLATEPLMPNLAISLHATTEEQRDLLVPINRKYGLKELLDACRRFPVKRRDRITFEYVMLKDVNDTDEDARASGASAQRHQGEGESAAAQRGRGDSLRAAVGRAREPIRADRGRPRPDGIGAQIARPRHPRRLRAADHRINSPEIAGPAPGKPDSDVTSRPVGPAFSLGRDTSAGR